MKEIIIILLVFRYRLSLYSITFEPCVKERRRRGRS